ncbi:MAG: hypothetical protein ACR2OX_04855 [Methyloligellaceae bacterium]
MMEGGDPSVKLLGVVLLIAAAYCYWRAMRSKQLPEPEPVGTTHRNHIPSYAGGGPPDTDEEWEDYQHQKRAEYEDSVRQITLNEAARLAFSRTHAARYDPMIEQTEEACHAYHVEAILADARESRLKIYGQYLHSDSTKEITDTDWFDTLNLMENGTAFGDPDAGQVMWRAISVKESSIYEHIWRLDNSSVEQSIKIADALDIIADHFRPEWGEPKCENAHAELAANLLREAANKGKIVIEGRREIKPGGSWFDERFDKIWNDIEPEYWRFHEFSLVVLLDSTAPQTECETERVDPSDQATSSMPCFAMLRVNKAAMLRLWPAPSPT